MKEIKVLDKFRIIENFKTNREEILRSIVGEEHYDFAADGLFDYDFKIVDDDQEIVEDSNTTVLSKSMFNKIITDEKDIAVCFLHERGHRFCNELWKACPVDRRFFFIHEINLIEEILIAELYCSRYNIEPHICAEYRDRFNRMYMLANEELAAEIPDIRRNFDGMLKSRYDGSDSCLGIIETIFRHYNPMHKHGFGIYVASWKEYLKMYINRRNLYAYEYGPEILQEKYMCI